MHGLYAESIKVDLCMHIKNTAMLNLKQHPSTAGIRDRALYGSIGNACRSPTPSRTSTRELVEAGSERFCSMTMAVSRYPTGMDTH